MHLSTKDKLCTNSDVLPFIPTVTGLQDLTRQTFSRQASYPPLMPTNCRFFLVLLKSFFPSLFFMIDLSVFSLLLHTVERQTKHMYQYRSVASLGCSSFRQFFKTNSFLLNLSAEAVFVIFYI